MKPVGLSIILPVHNESGYLPLFYRRLVHVLRRAPCTYEVIFVENGSTDGSYEILKALTKKSPYCTVIRSEKGWGNAVRYGLQKAQGLLFCYMVTDGQIDPIHILRLYSYYENHRTDVVKIRRVTRENTERLVISRMYNVFAGFLFGFSSRDINATPKLLKTDLAKSLKLHSKNIALDVELLIKLRASGKHWAEIGVQSNARTEGVSTTNVAAVFEMIASLLRFRYGTIKEFLSNNHDTT